MLGDAHLDVVVRQLGPLADDTDTPASTLVGPGGQAANVAAWVAALGGRSRLLYARGSDLAAGLVAADLTGRGVELAGPVVDGRTGVVVSLSDGGTRRSMITDRGVGPRFPADALEESWLDGCTWLHLPAYSLVKEPISGAALAAVAAAGAAVGPAERGPVLHGGADRVRRGPVHRAAGRAASRCGVRHAGRDRPDRRASRPGDGG